MSEKNYDFDLAPLVANKSEEAAEPSNFSGCVLLRHKTVKAVLIACTMVLGVLAVCRLETSSGHHVKRPLQYHASTGHLQLDETITRSLGPAKKTEVKNGASQASSQWEIQEHPFWKAVVNTCDSALKTFCPLARAAGKRRRFNSVMDCLEEHRNVLDIACKQTAFGGSSTSPNKLIFTTVSYNETTRVKIGYATVPLFFNRPHASPHFRTWFSMKLARKQSEKRGTVLMHFGGPAPSIFAVSSPMRSPEHLREEADDYYDFVSFDLRGMGLSALDLPFGDANLSVEEWYEFASGTTIADSFKGSLGSIFPSKGTYEFKNRTIKLPCNDVIMQRRISDGRFWLEPGDWANESETYTYFDMKSQITHQCTERFKKGHGDQSYDPLQWVGTSAAIRDVEWVRWAVGAPHLTLVGYSYGTRVVGAYVASFPKHVVRAAVSGVVAPAVDVLRYAELDGANFGHVLGFIQNQCHGHGEDSGCGKNPFTGGNHSEKGHEFNGTLNEAVQELFKRSENNGIWYEKTCGEKKGPVSFGGRVPMAVIGSMLTGFASDLGASPMVESGFQDKTWPWGFSELPTQVFYWLQNPCKLASQALPTFGENYFSVGDLIPALDMSGRWSRDQVVDFMVSHAKNRAKYPSMNYMSSSVKAAYGWPQLPMPIGFANKDVRVMIAQNLYDGPTGMNSAQLFRARYANSFMLTNQGGGHCVSNHQGVEAWHLMSEFLFHGLEVPDGTVTGEGDEKHVNFTAGHSFFMSKLKAQEDATKLAAKA